MSRGRYDRVRYDGTVPVDGMPKMLLPYAGRIAYVGRHLRGGEVSRWWSIDFAPGWSYGGGRYAGAEQHKINGYLITDIRQYAREAVPCACLVCLDAILGEDMMPLIEEARINWTPRHVLADALRSLDWRPRAGSGAIVGATMRVRAPVARSREDLG